MNIRSLSVILISVAPRRPKQTSDPTPIWKQLIFSGTSGPISPTIAKLCSSSSILSSLIVKNCIISYDRPLLAGTVIVVTLSLKSATDREDKEWYYSIFADRYRNKYTLCNVLQPLTSPCSVYPNTYCFVSKLPAKIFFAASASATDIRQRVSYITHNFADRYRNKYTYAIAAIALQSSTTHTEH